MALMKSSKKYIYSWSNLPTRLVKPVKDPTKFPQVISNFYRQINEEKWPKCPKLLKLCQGYTANMLGIKIGEYPKKHPKMEWSCLR